MSEDQERVEKHRQRVKLLPMGRETFVKRVGKRAKYDILTGQPLRTVSNPSVEHLYAVSWMINNGLPEEAQKDALNWWVTDLMANIAKSNRAFGEIPEEDQSIGHKEETEEFLIGKNLVEIPYRMRGMAARSLLGFAHNWNAPLTERQRDWAETYNELLPAEDWELSKTRAVELRQQTFNPFVYIDEPPDEWPTPEESLKYVPKPILKREP